MAVGSWGTKIGNKASRAAKDWTPINIRDLAGSIYESEHDINKYMQQWRESNLFGTDTSKLGHLGNVYKGLHKSHTGTEYPGSFDFDEGSTGTNEPSYKRVTTDSQGGIVVSGDDAVDPPGGLESVEESQRINWDRMKKSWNDFIAQHRIGDIPVEDMLYKGSTTTAQPLFRFLSEAENLEGINLFDPTKFGPAPAAAYRKLLQTQNRPPFDLNKGFYTHDERAALTQWWHEVFLPEVERQTAISTTYTGDSGTGGGGGGDVAAGDDGMSWSGLNLDQIVNRINQIISGSQFDIDPSQVGIPSSQDLFGGLEFNIGKDQLSVPGSEEVFGELQAGLDALVKSIGDIGEAVPGEGVFDAFKAALGGVTGEGSGLSGLEDRLAGLGIPDAFSNRLDEMWEQVQNISEFSEPESFSRFFNKLTGPTLRGIESIAGFETPAAFTSFSDALQGILSDIGAGGELEKGLDRGLGGVQEIGRELDRITGQGGSFGDLFSDIMRGHRQIDTLASEIGQLGVPDLNIPDLGDLLDQVKGLEDSIPGLESGLGGILGTFDENPILQNLIGALSSGNLGELENILNSYEFKAAIEMPGFPEMLQEALAPLGQMTGVLAQRLGPEGDFYKDIVGGITGLEGLFGEQFDKFGTDLSSLTELFGGDELSSYFEGIPGLTDIQSALGDLDFLTPENFAALFGGEFPGLSNLEGFIGEGGRFDTSISNLLGEIGKLMPSAKVAEGGSGVDAGILQSILDKINELGGAEGDLVPTSPGGFLQNLMKEIPKGYGRDQETADTLKEDPLTKSLLLDFDIERDKIEAQNREDLKRLGVLRGGDTVSKFIEDAEGRTRGRAGILADAATRLDDRRIKSLLAGTDLGRVLSQREMGIGEMLGRLGTDQTLSGREADLSTLAGILAALDPKLDLGTKNKRQLNFAKQIAEFLPGDTGKNIIDMIQGYINKQD
jgi:hypothetical protein